MRSLRGNSALSILLSATLLALGISEGASATSQPIEAYGDSLTAGFFSGTNVASPPGLPAISRILSELASGLFLGQRTLIQKYHRPELAWPQALATLEAAAHGSEVAVANLAVSGAKSSDLLSQIAASPGGAPRAYFFMGHNDLCNNPQSVPELLTAFRDRYSRALEAWDARHLGGTAYLIPIVNVQNVFSLLEGFAWYKGKKYTYSCNDSWNRIFLYCPFYIQQKKEKTLAAYLEPRVKGINEILDQLASEWDRRSTRNHFRYLPHSTDFPLQPNYFALDCFHLSAEGQQKFADSFYQKSH